MSRRRILWSELPPELLLAIADRLDFQTDIVHFRAVCKPWRRSASFAFLPGKRLLSPVLPHTFSTAADRLLWEKKSPSFTIPGNSLILVACSVFLIESPRNSKHPCWLLTVEERNQGKLYLREPLTRVAIENLPEKFPRVVDLSGLKRWEVGKFFTLRFADNPSHMFQQNGWRQFNHKVVLLRNPNCNRRPNVDDYSALILYDTGNLISVTLNGEKCKDVIASRGTIKFDDIVEYMGEIYAVDRRGRAYCCEYGRTSLGCVVDEALGKGCGADRKKRLVVTCGELYLIYRTPHTYQPEFTIYKLNLKQGKWEKLEGIGDDKIVFVTYDGSFVAFAEDFPGWKGNCIVYYYGCFQSYTTTIMDPDYGIYVFNFKSRKYKDVKSYPDVFCSSPPWLLADTACLLKCVPDEAEEEQRDASTRLSLESSSKLEMSAASMFNVENVETTNQDIDEEELPGDDEGDSFGATNRLVEIVENAISLEKFQGVNVSAYLVPILQQIWDKHGNVIQGHAARTDGLLSWALESLAKMIVILQSSGKSLSDSQAEYLDSSLLDLQLMRFNVDWLAPYVNSALARHKKKDQIRRMKELTIAKSRLLDELHEVEERMDEQCKLLVENLSVSSLVDSTKVLG